MALDVRRHTGVVCKLRLDPRGEVLKAVADVATDAQGRRSAALVAPVRQRADWHPEVMAHLRWVEQRVQRL